MIENYNYILNNKLDLTQKSMFKQRKFLPLGILANMDSNNNLSYLSILSRKCLQSKLSFGTEGLKHLA